MPAITKGMDFIGKTNFAVDILFPVMGELDSGAASKECSSGGSVTSVEVDGEGGLGSTLPKQPSNNLVKEEVSVPARATLSLPRPSDFSCAALLSRCGANSKRVTPYVKENNRGLKIINKGYCSCKINSNQEKFKVSILGN